MDFRKKLEKLFDKCFVLEEIWYKSTMLKYLVITTDRVIEVIHIDDKIMYSMEQIKLLRSGKITTQKHLEFQKGRFISNACYYMCPMRVLTVTEVPDPYGLITYHKGELSIKKEADWVREEYISRSSALTLLKALNEKIHRKK